MANKKVGAIKKAAAVAVAVKDATKEKAIKAIDKDGDGKISISDAVKVGKKAAKDIKEAADNTKESIEQKLKELDIQLENSINEYNAAYAQLNDSGIDLYIQRNRAVDIIDNVSELVSSIANSPKTFATDFEEIQQNKMEFKGREDFAKKELEAAHQAAVGAGAGMAAGAAVVSSMPTAAMWIATTFGTASTGTAISSLTGAAATNAALAWLGGGTLAAGGGGISAGAAFLAMAGPIGIGIAGASLLASIVLFSRKRIKNNKEKNKEIESVKSNTEKIKEKTEELHNILAETVTLREALGNSYRDSMKLFGADYNALGDEDKMTLGALVNNTKALSALFQKTI